MSAGAVSAAREEAGGSTDLRQRPMNARLGFLAQDTLLYGVATAVNRMLGLFTVPILTRHFSTADYGIVDAINSLAAVMGVAVVMGQDSAVARFFYELEDPGERRQMISQALLTQVVLCAAAIAVLWPSADWILRHALATHGHATAVRLLIAAMPFVLFVNFARNIFKWTFARREFLTLSLGCSVAVVILTFIAVIGLERGVEGVFLASLLGMGGFGVLGLFLCRRHLEPVRNFHYGRAMLLFGWPYMVGGLAECLVPALDRAFIMTHLGSEAMGLYAVGAKLALCLMLPIGAFQTAWGPFSLAIYKQTDASKTYDRVLTLYCSGVCLLVFGLVAMARPAIVLLASERYLGGASVVLPLALGLVLRSVGWITGIGVDLSKRTHAHLVTNAATLLATTLGILALMRPFGMVGVAYGVFLGQAAYAATATWMSYRVYPLRFDLKGALAAVTITFAAATAIVSVQARSPWWDLLSGMSAFALLGGVLWRGVLHPDDREVLKKGVSAALGLGKQSAR